MAVIQKHHNTISLHVSAYMSGLLFPICAFIARVLKMGEGHELNKRKTDETNKKARYVKMWGRGETNKNSNI